MGKKTAQRSERSQERLTRRHLQRLGELADDQHARYTRSATQGGKHAAWADRRVAVVLAQGAAQHFLHPTGGHGVKDLDVWTFYARRPSASLSRAATRLTSTSARLCWAATCTRRR